MSTRYFVPRDTTALAVGAESVARALAAVLQGRDDVTLVRNGSRGAFWLEPLLEIERDGQRVGFGPVSAAEVPGIVELDTQAWASHPLCLGDLQEHPWFAGQQRLTFARAGLDDPLCLESYLARHGFDGLEHAVHLPAEDIVDEITRSGLRGRGGAAFPAGVKWQTVLAAQGDEK